MKREKGEAPPKNSPSEAVTAAAYTRLEDIILARLKVGVVLNDFRPGVKSEKVPQWCSSCQIYITHAHTDQHQKSVKHIGNKAHGVTICFPAFRPDTATIQEAWFHGITDTRDEAALKTLAKKMQVALVEQHKAATAALAAAHAAGGGGGGGGGGGAATNGLEDDEEVIEEVRARRANLSASCALAPRQTSPLTSSNPMQELIEMAEQVMAEE